MPSIVLLIIQSALTVLSSQLSGKPGTVVNIADAMVDIVAKAKTIYEAETGQPLDVSKIKPFVPLP